MNDLFPPVTHHISLAEQLAELNREIGMRQRLYPKWVEEKKMKPEHAARCMAVIRAARDTIANLLKQEQGA